MAHTMEATPLLSNTGGPVQATDTTTTTTTPNPHDYDFSQGPYPPPPAYNNPYNHAYQQQPPPTYHQQQPPPTYAPPPPGYAPPQGYAPNVFGSAPPPSALPPTMMPDARGYVQVPCRVCAVPIQYIPKAKQSVVKCTSCSHGTQVGPPPQGKKFVLCQCNTLLSIPVTAKAFTCPKQHCLKTVILAPEDPGKHRAFCSHCSTLLVYRSVSAVVICPKCRGRSVVSRSRLHWYIGFKVLIGLIFIALGLTFTLGSYEASGGGIYFVFWGFCICGVLSLLRAVVYCSLNWRAKDAVYVPV